MKSSTQIISLGLVGIRGYGKKFIELIKTQPEHEFKTCFHQSEEVAKEFSHLLGIKSYFTDLELFLNDPTIQAVVLAVPNQFHFELTKKALLHGKHVWVEKPMTNTFEEALELVRISKENNLVLMVGHNHRECAHIQKIKDLLLENKIGKVVAAEFNMSHGAGLKFGPDKWRYHKELCPGGPLSMLGSHLIDTSNFLFGDVQSISGKAQNLYASTSSEDMSLVHIHYKSGVISSIVNLYNSVSTEFINIYGTEGALRYQRWPNEILNFQPKDTKLEADPYVKIPFEEKNSQLALFDKFIKAIQNKKTDLSNSTDALLTVKLICDVLEQSKNGTVP